MRKLLVLTLLLLTIIKIAAVLARGPVPIEMDASEYWKLSALVMEGDLLLSAKQIAYRTPVYPWFLAIARLIAGPQALMTIIVLQGLCALGTILIAATIASRATKLPSAYAWTLIVSLPTVSALVFGAAVLSESLFVFLMMVHLLAILDYAKYGTKSRAVWAGVTFALTLLTRPIAILLWIPHLIFLLNIHNRKNSRLRALGMRTFPLRTRLLHLVIACLAVATLTLPWMMRNQAIFGSPFITEFVGRNVWIVTFQDGSGAGLDLPDGAEAEELVRRLDSVGASESWRNTWHVSQALVRSGLDDANADRLMKSVSLAAAREDPRTFGYKAFRRVVNFWRCAATDLPPQGLETRNYFHQDTWQHSVPPVDWAIQYRWSQSVLLNTLLLGGLVGAIILLIINGPTRPYGLWMALILGYFSVVTGILEIPAYRYRIVTEPLVATAFGSAIAVLLSRRRMPARITGST
ncbi:MAG: ArnT family glycosyltransferase [Rubripirellula sp.]